MFYLAFFLVLATASTPLPGADNVALGIFLYGYDPFPNSQTAANQFGAAVFDLNFNTTAEGSCDSTVTIPYGCTATCDFTTSFSSDLTTTLNIQQIKSVLTENVGLNANYLYFVGSVSSSYQEMAQVMFEEVNVYNQISAQLTTWQLTCPYFSMSLSSSFQKAVSLFPTSCSGSQLQTCLNLIPRVFGHATGNSFLLGGRYFQRIQQTQEDYQELSSMGFDLSIAASMALANSISASYSGYISNQDYETYQSKSEFSSVENFGGFAPGANWTTWASTVLQKPQVLQVQRLMTLDNFLTPEFFPNDKQIDKKAAALREAISADLNSSLVCPNSCSNNGLCVADPTFHVGQCQCQPGHISWDCSQTQVAPIGTWCGFFNASWPNDHPEIYYSGFGCNKLPLGQCPEGWMQKVFLENDPFESMQFVLSCYSNQATNTYLEGTLCGLDQFSCQNYYGSCPPGFKFFQMSTDTDGTCYMVNSTKTLTGMLCGGGASGMACGEVGIMTGCPAGTTLQKNLAGGNWYSFCVVN